MRGSRWWCLFCPSWPRNSFMSKIWWHPKIPIVNSGAKLLKNLKNRFLSFFPTDFFYLWTKTLPKYQIEWEIWSQALAMRYIHAFVKAGRGGFQENELCLDQTQANKTQTRQRRGNSLILVKAYASFWSKLIKRSMFSYGNN